MDAVEAMFAQINTATAILGDRYDRDDHGALLLLLDWSNVTGLSVFTLAEWISADAAVDRTQVPSPRRNA